MFYSGGNMQVTSKYNYSEILEVFSYYGFLKHYRNKQTMLFSLLKLIYTDTDNYQYLLNW
jgi:hypothetical protein